MKTTKLSDREYQVLNMCAMGMKSFEIGKKLKISRHTVSTHKRNIMKKLRVPSMTSAVYKYYINFSQ
jgi:DNA-binding CsgD family transcriptional regulator